MDTVDDINTTQYGVLVSNFGHNVCILVPLLWMSPSKMTDMIASQAKKTFSWKQQLKNFGLQIIIHLTESVVIPIVTVSVEYVFICFVCNAFTFIVCNVTSLIDITIWNILYWSSWETWQRKWLILIKSTSKCDSRVPNLRHILLVSQWKTLYN